MEDQIFVSSFLFYETSNTICRKIDVYQFQRVIKEDNPLFSNPKKNRYHSKLEHPTNKKNATQIQETNYLPTGFIITRKFLKYADRNLILQLSFILMIHTFASKVSIMISFVNTLLSIKAPNSSVNCYRCHYEGSELK